MLFGGNMKKIFIMLLASFIFFSCKSGNDDHKLSNNKSIDEAAFQKELEKAVKYPSGKETVQAYFTVPAGNGPFPALIVIHEQWGLDDWIRTNADAFANKGYAALAIDLYRGKSTKKLDEAQLLMQGLSTDRVLKDLQAAYFYLQNNPKVDKKRIGVVGWGMGGGYALQASVVLPKLKAAVMNYGGLFQDIVNVKKIACPLLGIFGETDRSIPVMDVQNFDESLKEAKKVKKIIIYRNVAHAFMNPNNKEVYNAEITERAWREIFKFLAQYL